MLGYQYIQLRRWQDAERCLKHSVEITGDHYDYENLAKVYKAQGDTQRWKETLDEYLKQEDFGLDHARVRVEIAKHLMSHKEWEKAQPYAEAAAHTWAHWAMLCASECYEGMEDWEKSEQWIRRAAERYSSASISWFLWCK